MKGKIYLLYQLFSLMSLTILLIDSYNIYMESFLLPPQISKLFIQLIDVDFLNYCKYYGSEDKCENYLEHAELMMREHFKISWSLGGTSGSCWDDELREISEEYEPEMSSLVNFLKSNFTQLSEREIEEICNRSNYSEEKDGDYYGGCTTQAYKIMPFSLLGQILIDKFYPDQDLWTKTIYFYEFLKERSKLIIEFNSENYELFLLNEKLNENIPEKIKKGKKNRRLKI